MDSWLSGIGIILTFVGTIFIAWYDVFAKFRGESHGIIVPIGGVGKSWKLAAFIAWEKNRDRAMRTGLALIVIGTIFGIVGLWFAHSNGIGSI